MSTHPRAWHTLVEPGQTHARGLPSYFRRSHNQFYRIPDRFFTYGEVLQPTLGEVFSVNLRITFPMVGIVKANTASQQGKRVGRQVLRAPVLVLSHSSFTLHCRSFSLARVPRSERPRRDDIIQVIS